MDLANIFPTHGKQASIWGKGHTRDTACLRVRPEQSGQPPAAVNVIRANGGVPVFEKIVVFRPEERERGDQGAGADAGDHVKFGPAAGVAPAF